MKSGEYRKTYLKADPDFVCRNGRQVTIPSDLHRKIRQITTLVEIKGLNISTYIGNVLREHFSEWRDEISELFDPSIQED